MDLRERIRNYWSAGKIPARLNGRPSIDSQEEFAEQYGCPHVNFFELLGGKDSMKLVDVQGSARPCFARAARAVAIYRARFIGMIFPVFLFLNDRPLFRSIVGSIRQPDGPHIEIFRAPFLDQRGPILAHEILHEVPNCLPDGHDRRFRIALRTADGLFHDMVDHS